MINLLVFYFKLVLARKNGKKYYNATSFLSGDKIYCNLPETGALVRGGKARNPSDRQSYLKEEREDGLWVVVFPLLHIICMNGRWVIMKDKCNKCSSKSTELLLRRSICMVNILSLGEMPRSVWDQPAWQSTAALPEFEGEVATVF